MNYALRMNCVQIYACIMTLDLCWWNESTCCDVDHWMSLLLMGISILLLIVVSSNLYCVQWWDTDNRWRIESASFTDAQRSSSKRCNIIAGDDMSVHMNAHRFAWCFRLCCTAGGIIWLGGCLEGVESQAIATIYVMRWSDVYSEMSNCIHSMWHAW